MANTHTHSHPISKKKRRRGRGGKGGVGRKIFLWREPEAEASGACFEGRWPPTAAVHAVPAHLPNVFGHTHGFARESIRMSDASGSEQQSKKNEKKNEERKRNSEEGEGTEGSAEHQ